MFSASHVLYQEGYLTSNEIESLKTYDGYAPVTSYDSEAAVKFRELLASKGIDGIIYDNGHEGELSVLALYPEQIYTVAENGVDLNESDDGSNTDYRYFLGDNTDTAPAVDFKSRAENIIRLADMLQDGAKNDAEYAALSKVKNNAENIVQKYDELAKLKSELCTNHIANKRKNTADNFETSAVFLLTKIRK